MSNSILEKIAQELEENIVRELEKGTAPWIKPWINEGIIPYNPYTGTIYKGCNALRLMLNKYEELRYLTFNQVKELGGYVKKGEKASCVLFVGKRQIDKNQETKGLIFEDNEGNLWQKVFKAYSMFNISQCNNIDMEKLKEHQKKNNLSFETKPRNRFEKNPFIEQILANSNIQIIHTKQDKAYYEVSNDKIVLPPKENFINNEQYYSTALHELGHATGHQNRLNRDLNHSFGSEGYAREELRAELYSFLQAMELGIDYNLKNHASYMDSWLKVLKDDKSEISKAIKDSVKMVSFVKEHWYPTKEQIITKNKQIKNIYKDSQKIQQGKER